MTTSERLINIRQFAFLIIKAWITSERDKYIVTFPSSVDV